MASEGSLLAQGARDGKALPTFVRAHAKELADKADDQAEQLADAHAPDELAPIKAGALALLREVSCSLRGLQIMPDSKTVADHTARQLRRYASAARALQVPL